MIKLTVSSPKEPKTIISHQPLVTIGANEEVKADLSIDEAGFQGIVVRITLTDQHYQAINQANDPFVTLNDLPFGKKGLKSGDKLQIGKTVILLEIDLPQPVEDKQEKPDELLDLDDLSISVPSAPLFDTKDQLVNVLDEALKAKTSYERASPSQSEDSQEAKGFSPDAPLNFKEEWNAKEPFSEHQEADWQDLDFDALVKEVEAMAGDDLFQEPSHPAPATPATPAAPTPTPVPAPAPRPNLQPKQEPAAPVFVRRSIKDDSGPEITSEKESVAESKSAPETDENGFIINSWPKNWRLIVTILLALALFASLFLGTLYFSASGKRMGEELRAAQAIADISMALTYAQAFDIKPNKQNWSDPDFIRNNLNAVLSPNYNSLIHLDTHGHFKDSPYFLRIYNNSSLSQFLVIAQPVPSLLQWLIPKPSIIVDSRSMELRKLTDLRPLNRLLFASNNLDEEQAEEISRLVKEGELIPLNFLRSKQNRLGFSPPRGLGLLRPEAQDLIYNAPRYHLFGERLLEHAKMLTQTAASSKDLEMFRQEIERLSQFPHLLLYSSRGMEAALESQKALATFSPQQKFLIAFIKFHTKDGVASSHLLVDETSASSLPAEPSLSRETAEDLADAAPPPASESKEKEKSSQTLENEHPFTLQVKALLNARQQALAPIAAEIQQLLQHNQQNLLPNFSSRLQELTQYYIQIDQEQQSQVIVGLEHLYHDYQSLPLAQLMIYVRQAGAEGLVRSYLFNKQLNSFDNLAIEEEISSRFDQIMQSHSLSELLEAVNSVLELLWLDRIADIDYIIERQNELQALVLMQLDNLLLSPQTPLLSQYYPGDGKLILEQIFQKTRINDPDILDFYLTEWNHLKSNFKETPDSYEDPIEELVEVENYSEKL